MSAKHFIVTPEDVSNLVPDALASLVYQNPELVFDKKQKVIFRGGHDHANHVALLSGGGAGHEPAHAAYVGEGMLAAAVSGNVFASPAVNQILSGIRHVTGKAGGILIVKNYTGDVFHFHQAAEKARALWGLRVEVVVVGDDVSVGRERSGRVGRRGLAGTVFVHKILGALAATPGVGLDRLLEVAKKVTSGLATVGASLDHVHIPGQPAENAQFLENSEIELGMGIHNEPGVKRLTPQPSLSELLDSMIGYLLDTNDPDRSYVNYQEAKNTVLLVNNLGALSVLELSAITTHAVQKFAARGIKPARIYSGTFMTSLDGPGFSLTLLSADDEILSLLNAPTTAVGWAPPSFSAESLKSLDTQRILEQEAVVSEGHTTIGEDGPQVDPALFSTIISKICQSAIDQEPEITHADTIVGDGDCGSTLKRGAQAILDHFQSSSSPSLLKNLLEIANLVEDNMDGTSGAIYALFFSGLTSGVRDIAANKPAVGLEEWAAAAQEALAVVQKVTPARPGDRTLIDALEPFVLALKSGVDEALEAAKKGLESTKGMKPAFGRAVYVNEAGWDAVPDPGALSIVALATGLSNGLK